MFYIIHFNCAIKLCNISIGTTLTRQPSNPNSTFVEPQPYVYINFKNVFNILLTLTLIS